MRYYGMNNQNNPTHQSPMRQTSDFMEPQPMPQQNQTLDYPITTQKPMPENQDMEALPQTPPQNRTFNRSNEDDGLYKGQQAQNVRPINEWLENLPQAAWPPGSNPEAMGFKDATVYEYPAPISREQTHNIPEKSCPTQLNQTSFLCTHRGKVARVELGDGVTKSGILRNISPNYIVLEEKGSGNHIMCAMKAIKSIDLFA